VTSQCQSSTYYRDQIKPVFNADGSHQFALVSSRGHDEVTDGFTANARSGEIRFDRIHDIQRPGESLYFSLPPRFRGSRVTSYGGHLKFQLTYSATQTRGQAYTDSDIQLVSGDTRLSANLRPTPPVDEPSRYDIRLVESSFRRPDGSVPTRAEFLAVLAQLDTLLIRATQHTATLSASLRDVSMDTAVAQWNGQELAGAVEECGCPPGYSGLSCEVLFLLWRSTKQ
jgi:dystroglycan 1